jgi:hypothetical protein
MQTFRAIVLSFCEFVRFILFYLLVTLLHYMFN